MNRGSFFGITWGHYSTQIVGKATNLIYNLKNNSSNSSTVQSIT